MPATIWNIFMNYLINPQKHYEVETIVTPILQMRKRGHKKFKEFAQVPTAIWNVHI